MKTLREQFNDTLTPNGLVEVSIETTKALADMVTQVDALLEECAAIVESQARQDYGAQKLLAGFAPCEPDSVAIRLYDKLKKEGYGNDADR